MKCFRMFPLLRVTLALSLVVSVNVWASRVEVFPQSFEVGGWQLDAQFMDVMGSPYLLAHGVGKRVMDARATVTIPQKGVWRVWVRTRNWAPAACEAPGRFRVRVGMRLLETVFGTQGDAWQWVDGGEVSLSAGPTTIALCDETGFDGRCAGVVLTQGEPQPTGALSCQKASPTQTHEADLVVIGGGVSGVCAALASARDGLRTILVQDRPVLGGNASSEIRVWSAGEGIHNPIVRDVRGLFPNKDANALLSDAWRQRLVADETNLVVFTLMRAFGVEMASSEGTNRTIGAVRALDLRNNCVVAFRAPLFVDATGDGWVGYWAGAHWRMGREAADEYGESMAPKQADSDTLGASLMWTSARATQDVPFSAPWAEPFAQGEASIQGEWNWEYGIHRSVITQGEQVRDRLLLAIYGAFSNAKRNSRHARRVLDFVPFLLGKRESRRLLGDWVLSQRDITEKRIFDDAVASGSWSIDLHYDTAKPGVDYLTVCKQPHFGRYWIPFRSLYSRNVANLMMAGRCLSATHVGLGSPRVINTLAMTGVACGHAAKLCRDHACLPRDLRVRKLNRTLQRLCGGDWPGNPDPEWRHLRIVDDETKGVTFGKGWGTTHNCNGEQVGDVSHSVLRKEGVGDAAYPLEVPAPGRYVLYGRLPWLPWENEGTVASIDVVSAGKTSRLAWCQMEESGSWRKLATLDLVPGAMLYVRVASSRGPRIWADGFALAREADDKMHATASPTPAQRR